MAALDELNFEELGEALDWAATLEEEDYDCFAEFVPGPLKAQLAFLRSLKAQLTFLRSLTQQFDKPITLTVPESEQVYQTAIELYPDKIATLAKKFEEAAERRSSKANV